MRFFRNNIASQLTNNECIVVDEQFVPLQLYSGIRISFANLNNKYLQETNEIFDVLTNTNLSTKLHQLGASISDTLGIVLSDEDIGSFQKF